jgi:hypothetical protein
MKNHLKSGWKKGKVIIMAIFLVIIAELVQSNAVEIVRQEGRLSFDTSLSKRSLQLDNVSIKRVGDLRTINPRFIEENLKAEELKEKMEQLRQKSQSNDPVFHLQEHHPQFCKRVMKQRIQLPPHRSSLKQILGDKSEGQLRNLTSKQIRFMRKMDELRGVVENGTTTTTILPPPPPPPSPGGSISGIITGTDGVGIENVKIYVYDSEENSMGVDWSDPEGHYTVGDLSTGDYYVRTWNNQCDISQWYQDAVPWECDPPPVHVDSPSDTPNINFAFEIGGFISGHVAVEPSGEGIEEVIVEVYGNDGSWNYAYTDSNGNYSVCGLATGDYYVYIWSYQCNIDQWYQDAVPWEEDPPPVHVDSPSDTPNINFALEIGGSISGHVTVGPSGEGIEGVGVEVYDNSGNWIGYGWSDAEGRYTVYCLSTGDYYVRTWNDECYLDKWYNDAIPGEDDPPPVHVDFTGDTPNINFALEIGGSISGHVAADSSGEGIEGVGVEVYDNSGNWIGYGGYTDANGDYSVCGLATGDYYVYIWSYQCNIDQWYQDTVPWEEDPPPVHVDSPSDTPNINFALEIGGSISGHVTVDPGGEGIEGVGVEVYDNSGNWMGYGWSDAEGHYTVYCLSTGDYYVQALNDKGYLGKWYNNALNINDATLIHVEDSNNTPNINFALVVGGKIIGTITGCDTNPPLAIQDAQVRVEDWDTGERMGYSWSDVEGHYTTDGLPTGTYRVCVDAYGTGNLSMCGDTPVSVITESTTVHDICLEKGGKIIGTITECNTDPPLAIYHVSVRVEDWDTGERMGYGWSDCEGHFTADGLPTGVYRVCVEAYGTDYVSMCGDTPVTVIKESTTLHDMCLEEGGEITGTITGCNTDPPLAIQAEVRIEDWNTGDWMGYGWSDVEGHYTVGGLPTGSYRVCVEAYGTDYASMCASTPVEVIAESTTVHDMCLEEGGKIIGTITACDTDPPLVIPNAQVSVEDWDTGDYMGYGWSDSEGHYTVDGLPTGTYRVCADVYGTGYASMCGNTPIDVLAASTTLHDMCLEKGASISGTINCDNCDEGRICGAVWDGEPGLSLLLGSICVDVSNPTYTIVGLPLDTELWVGFWWDKDQEYNPGPPDCGDYAGFNENNPITLTDNNKNPDDINVILSEIPCECTSDGDCDDGLFCNGEETCIEGVLIVGSACQLGSSPCPGQSCSEALHCYSPVIPECKSDSECDDGLFCNGSETCISGKCSSGSNPCLPDLTCDEDQDVCVECFNDADCYDGLFCTGVEACVEGVCQPGTDRCSDDGLFCNGVEICDEENNMCHNSGNPCSEPTPVCDEGNDVCTAGEAPLPTILLQPDFCYQSRWFPLPMFMRIEGADTHFDASSTVTFNPENKLLALPLVVNEESILIIGLLMPSWLTGPINSMDVTVTTGSEEAYESLNINPLPFILDEGREMLEGATP